MLLQDVNGLTNTVLNLAGSKFQVKLTPKRCDRPIFQLSIGLQCVNVYLKVLVCKDCHSILRQQLAKVGLIQEAQILTTQTESKILGNGPLLGIQTTTLKSHAHLTAMTVATVLKCTLLKKAIQLKFKRLVKTSATGSFQYLDPNRFKLSCSDVINYIIILRTK